MESLSRAFRGVTDIPRKSQVVCSMALGERGCLAPATYDPYSVGAGKNAVENVPSP